MRRDSWPIQNISEKRGFRTQSTIPEELNDDGTLQILNEMQHLSMQRDGLQSGDCDIKTPSGQDINVTAGFPFASTPPSLSISEASHWTVVFPLGVSPQNLSPCSLVSYLTIVIQNQPDSTITLSSPIPLEPTVRGHQPALPSATFPQVDHPERPGPIRENGIFELPNSHSARS